MKTDTSSFPTKESLAAENLVVLAQAEKDKPRILGLIALIDAELRRLYKKQSLDLDCKVRYDHSDPTTNFGLFVWVTCGSRTANLARALEKQSGKMIFEFKLREESRRDHVGLVAVEYPDNDGRILLDFQFVEW